MIGSPSTIVVARIEDPDLSTTSDHELSLCGWDRWSGFPRSGGSRRVDQRGAWARWFPQVSAASRCSRCRHRGRRRLLDADWEPSHSARARDRSYSDTPNADGNCCICGADLINAPECHSRLETRPDAGSDGDADRRCRRRLHRGSYYSQSVVPRRCRFVHVDVR